MWHHGHLEEIKSHVDRGLSRAAIARLFDTTRNAVVGFCWRNGITGPNSQMMGAIIANERRRSRTERRAIDRLRSKSFSFQKGKPPKLKIPVCLDEPEPLRISLLDLNDSHCHWVCEGTDDNCMPTYCGHPTVNGRWCAHHYGRVYQ